MARGHGQGYLTYSAFVLLSLSVSTTSAADPGLATPEHPFRGLWTISIDNGPAPPPDQGPPWSVNAIRNKNVLPYEVIGIVAAYLGSIFVLGTLLLTVGRKARINAQTAVPEAQEMVKPAMRTFDININQSQDGPSHWYSPRKLTSKKSGLDNNPASPGGASMASFDTNVIELDKMKRAQEMERLYAAVLDDDDGKDQKATSTVTDLGSQDVPPRTSLASSPPAYGIEPQLSPNFSRKNPPRLVTDAPGLRHLRADISSPTSPYSQKSPIKAIYPSDMPQSATSSHFAMSPRTPTFWSQKAGPQSPHFNPLVRESRAASVSSHSSGLSGKRIKKSIRSLKISSPMPRGDIADNSDGARTPLSPRTYLHPGLPPEPPTAKTVDSYYVSTPGTLASWAANDDDRISDGEDEGLDIVRDLPHAHPQRGLSQISHPSQSQPLRAKSSEPTGSDLPFRQQHLQPATNPTGNLPFRQAQYSNRMHQPYTPSHPISAGPVKTTFVETRARGQRGPNSAALISAGLATPYSPYMPFTPITPVTPHIMSKTERRQRKKEEKATLGALTEEDQVQDEGDMWGSGY